MKQTGILLPVFSLPSPWGVGELGTQAYRFVDILKEQKITIWQILPLNPTGYGNSPYQPYSSFAGDEILISLEQLFEDGLLAQLPPPFEMGNGRVLYDQVRLRKEPYLREAFKCFMKRSMEADGEGSFHGKTACDEIGSDYVEFTQQEWVYQYGVFRALKKAAGYVCWNEWPKEWKNWPEDHAVDLTPYQEEIQYQIFLQFIFFTQWMKIKAYAGKNEVEIMGDMPFYVGVDSVDVWAGKKNFLLDEAGRPVFIAGVPPDYFSATGQRWGNPIYDWDYLKETGYRFWIERIGYSQTLFDQVRIDHFRAFDTYWKIPATCPTAVEGEWIEAPGYEVIDTVLASLPGISLVAEDLGDLRPEVGVLKAHYGFKGMRIVQFNIDCNGKYARDLFQDHENLIAYTGTHDNATTKEWYESLSLSSKKKVRKFLSRKGFTQGTVTRRLIEYTLSGAAKYAVIPAADILELGKTARLNVPGTVGSPNWEWRMEELKAFQSALAGYSRQIKERQERG